MQHQDIINVINQLPNTHTNGTRNINGINKLIVHHSAVDASPTDNEIAVLQNEALYQEHNQAINPGGSPPDGLQYHFVIWNGNIYQTRNLEDLLWHASDWNVNVTSLAVCVAGNYMDQQFPDNDRKALDNLIWMLSFNDTADFQNLTAINTYDGNSLFGHQEVADANMSTQCPGTNLEPIVKNARLTKMQSEVDYWNSKVAPSPVTTPAGTSTVDPKDVEIQALTQQVGALRDQLSTANSSISGLQGQVTDLNSKLDNANKQLVFAQQQLTTEQEITAGMQKQINNQKDQIATLSPPNQQIQSESFIQRILSLFTFK